MVTEQLRVDIRGGVPIEPSAPGCRVFLDTNKKLIT
jgi:hypothetical protein